MSKVVHVKSMFDAVRYAMFWEIDW